jgi:hypothetical protein
MLRKRQMLNVDVGHVFCWEAFLQASGKKQMMTCSAKRCSVAVKLHSSPEVIDVPLFGRVCAQVRRLARLGCCQEVAWKVKWRQPETMID